MVRNHLRTHQNLSKIFGVFPLSKISRIFKATPTINTPQRVVLFWIVILYCYIIQKFHKLVLNFSSYLDPIFPICVLYNLAVCMLYNYFSVYCFFLSMYIVNTCMCIVYSICLCVAYFTSLCIGYFTCLSIVYRYSNNLYIFVHTCLWIVYIACVQCIVYFTYLYIVYIFLDL